MTELAIFIGFLIAYIFTGLIVFSIGHLFEKYLSGEPDWFSNKGPQGVLLTVFWPVTLVVVFCVGIFILFRWLIFKKLAFFIPWVVVIELQREYSSLSNSDNNLEWTQEVINFMKSQNYDKNYYSINFKDINSIKALENFLETTGYRQCATWRWTKIVKYKDRITGSQFFKEMEVNGE